MKSNKLIAFIIAAALATFTFGCSKSTETNANGSIAAAANSSPGNANVSVNTPNNTAAPASAANNNPLPTTTEKTARNSSQATKDPAPQIGSGGNDLYLFTKTRAALTGDDELKAAVINININAGIVTLTGTVAGESQKAKAEQLIRAVEGVKGVKNQLGTSAGGSKR